MNLTTPPTRTQAIHEPLNKAQAYMNGVLDELRDNYPNQPYLQFMAARLEMNIRRVSAWQHDFEDRMLDEEAGC